MAALTKAIVFVPFELHGAILRHIVPVYLRSEEELDIIAGMIDFESPMRERLITLPIIVDGSVLVLAYD